MKNPKKKIHKLAPLLKVIILIIFSSLGFRFCSYVFSQTFYFPPSDKELYKVPYTQFLNELKKTFDHNKEPLLVETEKGNLYYYTKNEVFETKIPKESMIKEHSTSHRTKATAEILKSYNIPYEYYYFSWLMFFVFISVCIISVSLLFFLIVLLNMKNNEHIPVPPNSKFDSNRNAKFTVELPSISIEDVGGLSPQVKEEVEQAIMLFRKHKEITTFKIKPINGILFYGPPGTGKTMLAKAVANELKAKYFQVNGPEFVEKFVGVGPSRVRELFQEAKKHHPSVIFIDEIDAIGTKRDGNQNSEVRNTLNQLLIELSEIQNKQVLVIASTNHQSILDPALVRSGRFDYKINIELPDIEGRKEIIRIKTKDISMDKNLIINLDDLARSMYQMSGADIEDVFQKAQISALKANRTFITYKDVLESIERVILGTKGRIVAKDQLVKRVAYHEAGHALLSSLYYPSSIQKATIIPHSGSLGLVLTKETENNTLKTKTDLLQKIIILLAGGISEEIYFEEHSIGVSQDFEQAKKITQSMVADVGMTFEGFSFTTKKDHETEMKKIMEYCFEETRKMIKVNKMILEEIACSLIEKETITGQEIDSIVHKKTTL